MAQRVCETEIHILRKLREEREMRKAMKKMAALAAVAAGLALGAAADARFTYSGRIGLNSGAGFGGNTELPVRFRLYGSKTAAEHVWEMGCTVTVNKDGMFRVMIQDGKEGCTYGAGQKTLDYLFERDMVRAIGVAINGEAEIYPRQEMLSTPVVDRAETAGRLTKNPEIGTLKAGEVQTSASFTAGGGVTITDPVKLERTADSFTVDELAVQSGEFKARDRKFRMFARAPHEKTVDGGITSSTVLVSKPGGGGLIDKNSSGGFLVVVSYENWKAPCVTVPVGAGESYRFPDSLAGKVKLRFYPFGN